MSIPPVALMAHNQGIGHATRRLCIGNSQCEQYDIVAMTGYKHVLGAAPAASTTSTPDLAVVEEGRIKVGEEGQVVDWITIRDLDTSGKAVYDPVYLSTATAGRWVHAGDANASNRQVGFVAYVSATKGVVILHPNLFQGNIEQPVIHREVAVTDSTDVTVTLPGGRWKLIGAVAVKGTGTGGSGDVVAVEDDGGNAAASFDFDGVAAGTQVTPSWTLANRDSATGVFTVDPTEVTAVDATLFLTFQRY